MGEHDPKHEHCTRFIDVAEWKTRSKFSVDVSYVFQENIENKMRPAPIAKWLEGIGGPEPARCKLTARL